MHRAPVISLQPGIYNIISAERAMVYGKQRTNGLAVQDEVVVGSDLLLDDERAASDDDDAISATLLTIVGLTTCLWSEKVGPERPD